MADDSESTTLINCEEGRRLGCANFCCRLIVRLSEEEAGRFDGARTLEKGEDGLCIYLDRDTSLCKIWEQRPMVCREYTCNDDELLQTVLKEGFRSLKQILMSRTFIPKELYIRVPDLDDSPDEPQMEKCSRKPLR